MVGDKAIYYTVHGCAFNTFTAIDEIFEMELLASAMYSFGTLGKGFDEVMPHNDNEFLVKTIENVEKLHFLSFLVKN
jgi:hypothetical protein